MATTVYRRRGQTAPLRIDHSDVYFENDRLELDLSFDINTLQREEKRRCIARNAEIFELRKTFSQKRSESSLSLLQKIERKTSSQPTSAYIEVGKPPSSHSGASRSIHSNCKGIKFQRPVSVLIPETYSDETEASDSSSNSDTSEISINSDSDLEDKVKTERQSKPILSAPRMAPNSAAVTKKARIKAMLKTKKLEQIPIHWYSTVIPAKDVYVSYYVVRPLFTELKSDRPQSSPGPASHRNKIPFQRTFNRSSARLTPSRNTETSLSVDVAPAQGPPTKTIRQLQEMASQDSALQDNSHITLHKMAIKEEKLKIDKKVKDFIFSLEQLKKSKIKSFLYDLH